MAFAALISLKHTIQRLLSSCDQIPVLPFSPEILQLAYEEVKSLQALFTLEDGNNERVKAAMEKEIREAACRLEDVLEQDRDYEISYNPLTQSEDSGKEMIREEINFFTETVKKIKEELINSSLPGKDDAAVSSRTDHVGGKKAKMFGLDDDLIKLKDLLIGHSRNLKVVVILGMAGIGKTTLAREVYVNRSIQNHFECSAFVSIGPKYALREILLGILAQINPENDPTHAESDEELARYLYCSLEKRRYLIVLDDVWNTRVWDEFERILPDPGDGSRVMLTTRLEEVACHAIVMGARKYIHRMRFLTEADSWHLLCERVFDEDSCPPQLEKAGKEIAKECEGLPLSIIRVARHLRKAEKTAEYWKKVVKEVNSVIVIGDEEVSKTLMLSYKYLPQHLRACFLYMGVFPHDYEIPTSKLIKLWRVEGFLEPNPTDTFEDFSMECLENLVFKSVLLVCERNLITNRIKTCRVHSVFHYLCIREAGNDKFFHVINGYANQGIESQRRLCIHDNVLFGIKDVYKSMASVSDVRSLLCTGPYHQYPVPVCLRFSLLRVLDAVTIRFYKFPIEVVKLVRLRYLAFTYNGKLLASISKLWNLEYLIVRQHQSIISSGARPSYLPMEIWNMRELRHLQVPGSDLPDPNSEGALLPNLTTLLGITAHSCTKEVLGRIPNLKKLGIQIELPPDAAKPLCCFDDLSHLCALESLKCVIVNPTLSSKVVALTPPPASMFPSSLKKLTLSGLGFPWERMSSIAELPNLEVLKLRCYAFQGPVWKTSDSEFPRVKHLLLEDTDLEKWQADDYCFPVIECLTIRHCYKLQSIPLNLGGRSRPLEMIELVDCKPSVVGFAKVIQYIQIEVRNIPLQLIVISSEDEGKRQVTSSSSL